MESNQAPRPKSTHLNCNFIKAINTQWGKKVSSTNDVGLSECWHVEEYQQIHIYCRAQKSSPRGSKMSAYKTRHTELNIGESRE